MKKELWKTEPDADELLRLVVSLLADEEVRRFLLLWQFERLPVIRF